MFLLRLLAILTFTLASSVYSQQLSTGPKDELPNDFLTLADLRGKLSGEIPQLEKDIKDLERSLPQVERDEKRLADLRDQAKKAESDSAAQRKKVSPEDIFMSSQFGFVRELNRLEGSLRDTGSSEKMRASLAAKRVELEKKSELAQRVYIKITKIIGPEQQFKRDLSLAFTALIGLVVIGFFVMVFRDQAVRDKIFSGQAGIQFLTLFSLVIAIILFGMTGVLEGKELAALLGGISGFILGKVA